MNATEERILGVLSSQFKIDPDGIGADRTFADLSIDSLVIIEIGLALEDEFGVPISDGELQDGMTIGDAADLIAAKQGLVL